MFFFLQGQRGDGIDARCNYLVLDGELHDSPAIKPSPPTRLTSPPMNAPQLIPITVKCDLTAPAQQL